MKYVYLEAEHKYHFDLPTIQKSLRDNGEITSLNHLLSTPWNLSLAVVNEPSFVPTLEKSSIEKKKNNLINSTITVRRLKLLCLKADSKHRLSRRRHSCEERLLSSEGGVFVVRRNAIAYSFVLISSLTPEMDLAC